MSPAEWDQTPPEMLAVTSPFQMLWVLLLFWESSVVQSEVVV